MAPSDYEVEERINDSILFSEFLGLDMGVAAPDHSTISRFRLELTRLGVMDKLLKELNKQFKKQGISHIDHGAIIDASIVDSPHAPDGSILIKVADDREDLRTTEEQAQEEAYQYELKSRKPGVDTEARWVRKGRRYRYGSCTDRQSRVGGSTHHYARQLLRYGYATRSDREGGTARRDQRARRQGVL